MVGKDCANAICVSILAFLSIDELISVAAMCDSNDLLCFSLACSAFNNARLIATSHETLRTDSTHMTTRLSLLEWACESMRWLSYPFHWQKACSWAAHVGNLETLSWLRKRGAHCGEDACASAAAANHVDVLRQLHADGCASDWRACACAALHPDGTALRVARAELQMPWDEMVCSNAAGAGHLQVLQWARANGAPWDTWTMAAAAGGGHLHVLEWLWSRDDRPEMTCQLCAFAAAGAQLHVLKWARCARSECSQPRPTDRSLDQQRPRSRRAQGARRAMGLADVLGGGEPRLASTLAVAAKPGLPVGRRDVRAHIEQRPAPTLIRAALNSSLSVSLPARRTAAAAQAGHLDLLQWCRLNGCPWTGEVVLRALEAGFEHVAEWAIANGCEDPIAQGEPSAVDEELLQVV